MPSFLSLDTTLRTLREGKSIDDFPITLPQDFRELLEQLRVKRRADLLTPPAPGVARPQLEPPKSPHLVLRDVDSLRTEEHMARAVELLNAQRSLSNEWTTLLEMRENLDLVLANLGEEIADIAANIEPNQAARQTVKERQLQSLDSSLKNKSVHAEQNTQWLAENYEAWAVSQKELLTRVAPSQAPGAAQDVLNAQVDLGWRAYLLEQLRAKAEFWRTSEGHSDLERRVESARREVEDEKSVLASTRSRRKRLEAERAVKARLREGLLENLNQRIAAVAERAAIERPVLATCLRNLSRSIKNTLPTLAHFIDFQRLEAETTENIEDLMTELSRVAAFLQTVKHDSARTLVPDVVKFTAQQRTVTFPEASMMLRADVTGSMVLPRVRGVGAAILTPEARPSASLHVKPAPTGRALLPLVLTVPPAGGTITLPTQPGLPAPLPPPAPEPVRINQRDAAPVTIPLVRNLRDVESPELFGSTNLWNVALTSQWEFTLLGVDDAELAAPLDIMALFSVEYIRPDRVLTA